MTAHVGPQSTTRQKAEVRARAHAAASTSWIALVAATSIGLSTVSRMRAEISVAPSELNAARAEAGEYRLVVQAYSQSSVVNGVPVSYARPLASTQRSVTAAELTEGVAVDVVELGEPADESAILVAWLERGSSDLDFDGRRARPVHAAYVGAAASSNAPAQIVLQRRSV